ncbi:hypothetical protein ABID92_002113 [Frigoribacterium sp. PvP120]|jgi:hypothetical protein|nr:hypothetical protein [Frigoribacterium sp. PvP121]NII52403.1 hypothetical protein [Frigoribacterium endophyticum]
MSIPVSFTDMPVTEPIDMVAVLAQLADAA